MQQIDFVPPHNRGKKPELFLVLDCETATLPFVGQWNLTPEQKLNVSMAAPLVYDIAWKVIDRKLNVYSQHSFLVQETFFVPAVFNTAYYKEKRPIYMEKFNTGEIIAKNWKDIIKILQNDLQYVSYSTAYNAMFDFKKAIPFTERYIYNLYSKKYNEWEERQKKRLQDIASGWKEKSKTDFDPVHFTLRKIDYPLIDIWGLACKVLINEDKYKKMCLENGMISKSGLYFKTSAEASFRYLMNNIDFDESHIAFEDVEIESVILTKALKKERPQPGIEYFPFKDLGTTIDHVKNKLRKNGKPYYSKDVIENLIQTIYMRLDFYENYSSFATNLETRVMELESWKGKIYGPDSVNKERFSSCYCSQILKQINRTLKRQENLVKDGRAWKQCELELENLREQYDKYSKYVK